MWVNLGLFLLVWETLGVLMIVPVRVLIPDASADELLVGVLLSGPAAAWLTRWIDVTWLDAAQMEPGPEPVSQFKAVADGGTCGARDGDQAEARHANPA